jgi:hypothetical protein
MPIARVVARRFEDALEFAENLRSWFSVIEIAAPEHRSSSAVALEICLDESSPREALGRVLEYVADHPFVAEPAQDPALLPAAATQPAPEAATQAGMVSALGAVTPISSATIETTAAAAAPMATAAAPAAGETLPSWRKSLRAFFRVRSTQATATSVVLQTSDANSQTAARRPEKNWRQQREAQFWVPPAYKEPAWSEEERRHREQLEHNRLAEIELQRQRVVEARRERDRQLALQLAAERERLEREEQQRRAARQEQLRMPPASVPVPTAAVTRQPASSTLTPRLRRREARLWKQAVVLATAAAMLIAVAIAEYANRGVPGGATEVEREPAQVLPMKPAADEGAPKASPVLLTSAENEPNHGERVNSPVATWHRRTGRDEIDYVARDVTIRYFEHGQRMNDTPRGRSTNAVVRQVEPPAARHTAAGIKQISDLDQN